MKRTREALILTICVTVLSVGASSWVVVAAKAEESTITQMMGDNFAGMRNILVALITADYKAVPAQMTVLHEHAVELTEKVPKSAETDRERYLSYAYNLDGHVKSVKSISELLIKRDQERGADQLETDYLREALASHYGGMVTMCVACHNRFRPGAAQ